MKSTTAPRIILFTLILLTAFVAGTKQKELAAIVSGIPGVRSSADTISARDLAARLKKKDFTFINVHTPYEGEIAGTDLFVAYDQIVADSANLPKDKNTAIILYCRSGRMSAEAIPTLRKLGYTNVRHLSGGMQAWTAAGNTTLDLSRLQEEVVPKAGIELPFSFGGILPRLVSLGVIDLGKFKQTVNPTPEQLALLTDASQDNVRITPENSQFIVDVLWAIGLAQKSLVYDRGPMGTEYKKDIGNFASTGGWSLARGNAVSYLNRFDLVSLTSGQQEKVAEIAKNVYRPCCGNSTWFPDCNHGMAALAAIELMVAAGKTDEEIYRAVLALNSYWFPTNYLVTATYFARRGTPWDRISPKDVLGSEYSSGQGAAEISKKVGPLPFGPQTGGGCSA